MESPYRKLTNISFLKIERSLGEWDRQQKGHSNAQENPCYVNLLSTEKTNSSLNAAVILSSQKIKKAVILRRSRNMVLSFKCNVFILTHPGWIENTFSLQIQNLETLISGRRTNKRRLMLCPY